ncbi:flavo protein [Dentipellis sp. KUC8613]|nr:flavo protein [Dentipellis sp. KUC8613]
MSVKTIAVLDENELQDGQMKEVAFESGKVLLSRLGDKVHATSAFCTHYGAPLAKGVLTADGRVVCPWHGACFNVCNGDIEDAPAPNALHSYKAHVADGKIHVTADPSSTTKENMSRQPRLLASGAEVGGPGVVIVGGGSAAFHAVESLREHGYKGPITILSSEKYSPIDRTKLSKALITDASKLEWRSPADLKIKYGTTLRIGVAVTSVDTTAKTVTLEDGKDHITYDKLILATGGLPRRLPIDGADLANVYTLRTVGDAKLIDEACQEGKKLVVIGSSFISMELVAAVSKRKLASIHVIGMEEYPFEAVLGKEVGAGLKKYHESQGVVFHPSTSVKALVPSSSTPTHVGSVVLASGETLEADAVIMGVGVRPATDYLRASGWQLEKDGSVKVDEYLRVIGKQDVYAVGDIATYPQLTTGEYRRVEHWNVAGNHGRAVGKTIAGDPQPFVKVPVFWSAQGQQLRYCGVGYGWDDIIIKGNPAELKFIAYYAKGGKVVAVASMQNDPVVMKASELLRLGLMPSPEELRANKDLLEVDVSSSNVKPLVH